MLSTEARENTQKRRQQDRRSVIRSVDGDIGVIAAVGSRQRGRDALVRKTALAPERLNSI